MIHFTTMSSCLRDLVVGGLEGVELKMNKMRKAKQNNSPCNWSFGVCWWLTEIQVCCIGASCDTNRHKYLASPSLQLIYLSAAANWITSPHLNMTHSRGLLSIFCGQILFNKDNLSKLIFSLLAFIILYEVRLEEQGGNIFWHINDVT